MQIFLAITSLVVFLLMILVGSISPTHTTLTVFELERRSKAGDRQAKKELNREKMLGAVSSLKRIILAFLAVLSFLLIGLLVGQLLGILLALILIILAEALTHSRLFAGPASKFFEKIEPGTLGLIKKFPGLFGFIGGPFRAEIVNCKINSRQELEDLIFKSSGIISEKEKKAIIHGLSFDDKKISQVMTPRKSIVSVKKNEFLGPLILDDLSKLGHSNLPVVDGNLNRIVGVLNIDELMNLNDKVSVTAEEAMQAKPSFISENKTLSQALEKFLQNHHQMMIVVNAEKQTVGLITLRDVIEEFFGREIGSRD